MKIKVLQNWTYQNIIWTKYFIIKIAYIFLITINWKNYIINVPEWFITDLWSIPPIIFFYDKSRYISYILHDYLYSLIGKIINIYWELAYDQKLADKILNIWLWVEGMSKKWRVWVCIWLKIWWRFNYKKWNKEISDLKKL